MIGNNFALQFNYTFGIKNKFDCNGNFKLAKYTFIK